MFGLTGKPALTVTVIVLVTRIATLVEVVGARMNSNGNSNSNTIE